MGMQKYMGYQAKKAQDGPERELPQVSFKGTLFYVDIHKHEFRQVDNPANRITMGDLPEEMGFSHFLYDSQTRNRYAGPRVTEGQLPEHVCIILLPPMKELDPQGLARRQGLPPWKEEHLPGRKQPVIELSPAKERKKGNHL